MQIHGLQKLTLLDFPGHTACTVFTGACNWRCPFCHNASLVLNPTSQPILPVEEIFSLLEKRHGLLDGVAITGGEPTLQKDLPDFIRQVKNAGFAVKLDTNGTNPTMLSQILQEGLVDYVAMDIKGGKNRYATFVGTENTLLENVEQSVAMLLQASIDYEFRTTIVKPLHQEEDFESIGQWIQGAKHYYLQGFKDSGDLIGSGLEDFKKNEALRFLEIVQKAIPVAELRGYD